jgi:hypothetical protein
MKHPHAFRFKENTIDFIDFLADVVREVKQSYNIDAQPENLDFTCIFIKAFDKDALVDNFIYGSRNNWDYIFKQDESYFIKDFADIFKFVDLPEKEVYIQQLVEVLTMKKDNYKVLPNDPHYDPFVVGKKDRDIVWDYLYSFVKISIQYLHAMGQPVEQDGRVTYIKPLYKDIDVQEAAKKWGVKLTL